MKYLFVGSLLVFCSCAPLISTDPRSVTETNVEFNHYVDIYLNKKGMGMFYNVPIGFARLSGNTIGMCTIWSSKYRQIQIDPVFWSHATENDKITLIAHELGHCDLNRKHSPNISSIMYPIANHQWDFDELFGRSASTRAPAASNHVH